MKNIAVLGSTGSIGKSTLEVVSAHRDRFRVVGLAAGKNIDLLEQQILDFRPEVVAVSDKVTASSLQKRISGIEVLPGIDGVNAVASHESADFVLSAIVGSAGLMPTLSAVRAGKTVGIANKESLVMAGHIVMAEAKSVQAGIIPVDSEHNAVFQCLEGRRREDVRRIILTASGGPFVDMTGEDLAGVTPEDALRHPNWSMGRKITIDSATLMNKGLEVIEACWLFDLPHEKVDVLIHPQSIVHSMVEFRDRGMLAQLSVPDMKGPIAYALSYPERLSETVRGLDLGSIETLTFRMPDRETFPCLTYAYEAIRQGGTMPCVLNAANEIAVHAFIENRIGFTDIPVLIQKTMDSHKVQSAAVLGDVFEADRWAREKTENIVRSMKK